MLFTIWLNTLPIAGPRTDRMMMITIATRTRINAYSTKPWPFFCIFLNIGFTSFHSEWIHLCLLYIDCIWNQIADTLPRRKTGCNALQHGWISKTLVQILPWSVSANGGCRFSARDRRTRECEGGVEPTHLRLAGYPTEGMFASEGGARVFFLAGGG